MVSNVHVEVDLVRIINIIQTYNQTEGRNECMLEYRKDIEFREVFTI